jgi:hypothetical protein
MVYPTTNHMHSRRHMTRIVDRQTDDAFVPTSKANMRMCLDRAKRPHLAVGSFRARYDSSFVQALRAGPSYRPFVQAFRAPFVRPSCTLRAGPSC